MPEPRLAIVKAQETLFFSHWEGKLCQWVLATIENRWGRPMPGTGTIAAAGEEVATPLEVAPGVREYRCYAPTLWPHHPPVAEAPVRLTTPEGVATAVTSVGHHRPWTVYLLSDVCTDYTWVYHDEESCRADDADLMEAELALAEATR